MKREIPNVEIRATATLIDVFLLIDEFILENIILPVI
jgi:hypothetical protein